MYIYWIWSLLAYFEVRELDPKSSGVSVAEYWTIPVIPVEVTQELSWYKSS